MKSIYFICTLSFIILIVILNNNRNNIEDSSNNIIKYLKQNDQLVDLQNDAVTNSLIIQTIKYSQFLPLLQKTIDIQSATNTFINTRNYEQWDSLFFKNVPKRDRSKVDNYYHFYDATLFQNTQPIHQQIINSKAALNQLYLNDNNFSKTAVDGCGFTIETIYSEPLQDTIVVNQPFRTTLALKSGDYEHGIETIIINGDTSSMTEVLKYEYTPVKGQNKIPIQIHYDSYYSSIWNKKRDITTDTISFSLAPCQNLK